jgi:prepilin-type N-terminal cleavage/methylation domain-containing protein
MIFRHLGGGAVDGGASDRSVRDRGMTFTELLLTVAILGLVMAALSGAVVLFLRTQGDPGDRVDQTRGLQQLVNYLPADVASAQRIEFDAPWTSPCLTLGQPELNLIWSESFPGDDTETVAVTYIVAPDGTSLVRSKCRDGGGSESTTVARNVGAVTIAPGSVVPGQVDLTLEYEGEQYTISGSSRNR